MNISLKEVFEKNKILKNFSVLTLSNSVTQVLFIFSSIRIARVLNPLTYGTYNLLQLHISIFVVIASLGLRNIIIRSIARDKTIVQKVFYISAILRTAGFLFSILIFSVYFLLYHNYSNILFIWVIVAVLATSFLDLFESVAFGLEKMEFSGLINLSSTLLWVISILIIPKSELTVNSIFGLFVIFGLLKTIVYFFLLYRGRYLKDFTLSRVKKEDIVVFSQECFPYYYLGLFTLLSNQIPLLFLEYRSGIDQIGYFNIASKVLMPINLVLTTALAAVFPNLSRLFVTNFKGFIKNVKLIFVLISLFGIAGAFGVTLFRKEVVQLLYGEKYISSSLVMGYQCWYIAVYSAVCLVGTILGAINRQKELSYLSVLCTIIQVPILWYGAKYGAEYLSAAFLVATAINFLIHIYVINLYLRKELAYSFYLKIGALFVIGYSISLLTPDNITFINKVIIFVVCASVSGYFLYKRYSENIKKIFSS